MAKRWVSPVPHQYPLDPNSFAPFLRKFHLVMEKLSDDEGIRAKQRKNFLWHKKHDGKINIQPKYDLFDCNGRRVFHGDYVMVTNKLDRFYVQVVASYPKFLVLEDVVNGGRCRAAVSSCVVVTDQIISNIRREEMSKNLKVGYPGRDAILKVSY